MAPSGRAFLRCSVARRPVPSDEEWALSSLLEGEQVLWGRMSGPDRRHAVGVARETVRLLGAGTPRKRARYQEK